MSNYLVGITLKADGSGLVGALRVSEAQVESLTRSVDKARNQLGLLSRVSGNELLASTIGLGFAELARRAIAAGDTMTDIAGKIREVSSSQKEATETQRALLAISKDTYSSLSANAQLYARVSTALKETNATELQRLEITRSINNALLISRATTQESESAILQLSQAFGSGRLAGEEFNAVNEASPRLMRAIAEAMNVPVGALKSLAEQGKITSAVLLEALSGASATQLAEEAARVPLTVGRAWTNATTDLLVYVGGVAQASGATALLANTVNQMGAVVALAFGGAALYGVRRLAEFIGEQGKAMLSNQLIARDYGIAQAEMNAALIAQENAKVTAIARRGAAEAVTGEAEIARQLLIVEVTTERLRMEMLVATGIRESSVATSNYNIALTAQAKLEQQLILAKGLRLEATAALATAETAAAARIVAGNTAAVASTGVLAGAMGVAGAAARGLLAIVGGWAGVALLVAGAVYYLSTRETELGKTLEQNTQLVEALSKATDQNRAALTADAAKAIEAAQANIQLAEARKESAKSFAKGSVFSSFPVFELLAGVAAMKAADSEIKEVTQSQIDLATAILKAKLNATEFGAEAQNVFSSALGSANPVIGALNGIANAYARIKAAQTAAGDTAIAANAEAAQKQTDALARQIALFGKGQEATARYELQQKLLSATTDAQRAALELQYAQMIKNGAALDGLNAAQEASRKATQLGEEAIRKANQAEEDRKRVLEQSSDAFKQLGARLDVELGGPLVAIRQRFEEGEASIKAYSEQLAASRKSHKLTADEVALLAAATAKLTAVRDVDLRKARDQIAAEAAKLSASAETLAALDQEIELLGLSVEARRVEEIVIRAVNQAKRDGKTMSDEDTEALRENVRQRLETIETMRQQVADAKVLQEVVSRGAYAMADALADFAARGFRDSKNFIDSFKQIWKRAVSEMIADAIRLKVIKPILDGIFKPDSDSSQSSGGLSELLGGLFGGGGDSDKYGKDGKDGGSGSNGGYSSIGAALAASAFAGAAAGALGGNQSLATIGATIGSIFGPIGTVVGAILGGAIGGSYKNTGAGATQYSFGGGGVSGVLESEQAKQRSFFRGTAYRTVTDSIGDSGLKDAREFWLALTKQVTVQAALVGSTLATPVAFSFRQEFDKAGNVIAQYGTVLGRRIDGTIEEIQARVAAESTIAVVASVAGNSVQGIAERYRTSTAALVDAGQFLLAAQADIIRGTSLLAAGVKLDAVTDFVESNRAAGETLLQAYARLSASAEVVQQAITNTGLTLDYTREEFVKFAAGVVTAAGGLDEARNLFASFYQSFYDEGERLNRQVELSRAASDTQLSALNIPVNVSMAEFRTLLETVMPTLTAEATVEWLRAGNALAAATAAQTELNNRLGQYADFMGSVRVEIEAIGATDFQKKLADIRRIEAEQIARANQLARAANLQGAAENDLVAIHVLAARRTRQAIDELRKAALDIIGQLRGIDRQQLNAGSSGSGSGEIGQIDGVAEASRNRYEEELAAIEKIHEFARNLNLDERLSPLVPMQRFAEAQARYQDLLMRAQAGDVDAQNELVDAARTYLDLARDAFSSGDQYQAIFDAVRASLLGITPSGQPGPTGSAGGTGGYNGSTSSTSDFEESAEQARIERMQLATQLIEYLRDLAEATGQNVLELAAELGEPLNLLVEHLGINLTELTVETTNALADVASGLGIELSELTAGLDVELGALADRQSLLNDALEARINALPEAQRDKLMALFRAVEDATTEASANAAIAALEEAVGTLPAEQRNEFAAFFDSIDIVNPELDYLGGIAEEAHLSNLNLTDILAEVRRIGLEPPAQPSPPVTPPVTAPPITPPGGGPGPVPPGGVLPQNNPNTSPEFRLLVGAVTAGIERQLQALEKVETAQGRIADALDRQTLEMVGVR